MPRSRKQNIRSLDPPAGSSMADRAYALLKRQIIRCTLEPGRTVTEAELVRETGIGKTPVREALARLVQEGLVRSLPRLGYEVTPITLRDVREMFGVRLIVEPAAVELAAGRVDAEQLRKLDAVCSAATYRPGDHDSTDEFLRLNHEFHATIAHASGNRRLADLVIRVLEESERLFQLGMLLTNRSDEMVHEHRELVDALAAGDAETAGRCSIEQIQSVQRMVVDALMSSPDIQSTPVTTPSLSRARVFYPERVYLPRSTAI